MINATDLKNGTNFLLDGKPYRVIKYSHSKIGRGGANVKVQIRNLENGSYEQKTFSSNHKFEEITTTKKTLQYLYKDSDSAYFMDTETYDQSPIPLKNLEDEMPFLSEGQSVEVLYWDQKPLSVEIPPKVVLEVTQTVPGVKGNSATNVYKPATLENGLELKVPLFIKKGNKIRVDTRTKEYIERVN